MRRLVVLIVLALAATACGGGGGDDDVVAQASGAEADEGTKADVSPSDAAPNSAGSGAGQADAPDDPVEPIDNGDDGFGTIVLSAAGIDTGSGVLTFGTDADTVISEVTGFLGPPTNDSGSIDPIDAGCPVDSDTFRTATWGAFELVFFSQSQFSDGPTEHLAFWFNPDFEVAAFAFVGDSTQVFIDNGSTTVADLREALGSAVDIFDDELFGPSYVINDNFGELRGELSGLTDDDVVISANSGIGCGE